jgi:hypothetical protein
MTGTLAHLGHEVSDQTVGNVLRRYGIAPAPKRSQTTTWKDFIASHMAVMSGMDFFTAEVLTWRGPATYHVLFVIQLETRRVALAGMTRHPSEEWMEQVARNLTDVEGGALHGQRYVLHDRDAKFCAGFRSILHEGGVEPLRLPPSSPDLKLSRNGGCARQSKSVFPASFCSVRIRYRALNEYVAHFHAERPHQGKGNVLLFPELTERGSPHDRVECRQRLGGLLRYMHMPHEYFD